MLLLDLLEYGALLGPFTGLSRCKAGTFHSCDLWCRPPLSLEVGAPGDLFS